ncbi:MAG TPA: ABC transporter ATP-binding protein [Acidobacteriaceae bacterium]|nr:ABC transporter ATP-binding protein [Acidobacteriaceae bacterium]
MAATTVLESLHPTAPRQADAAAVASLRSVTKHYGNQVALDHLSLDLHRGEIVALLGPNGAGKTTAVRLMLGLITPTSGSVHVLGGDPRDHKVRANIGAMLQVARMPETLRVREYIDLFRSYYPNPLSYSQSLALGHLDEIKDRLFGDLSGGQKQRVLFALAACGDPDLLFLDEPTVGMDIDARRTLWGQIRSLAQRGKTVLLTTHYLEEADALAHRVIVLNHGKIIAEGTSEAIKRQVSGSKIRCITTLEESIVCAIPSVVNVTRDREALLITTTDAESVVRSLFQKDPSLSGLQVTSAGLDDAFLALTKSENPKAN